MINFKFKITGIILFILIPSLALAATVYLTTDYPSIAIGDTIIVNLAMDTLDKRPNVVEGDVLIKNGAENIKISEFSLADSVLTHWPKTPSLDSGSKISFAGGVPGGFNQKSGLLFKIVFLAEKEGQVVFSPADIKAYDNDGKATPIEVSINPLTINIGPKKDVQPKNQWLEIISKDNQPPQYLVVAIGQDNSVFEGKKFIAISAVDNQSGIDYYEVAEGNWPTVRSGNTYVLQDQTESSTITVIAYDKAGNFSKILIKPKERLNVWNYIKLAGLIIIILFALIFILYKKFSSQIKKKFDKRQNG